MHADCLMYHPELKEAVIAAHGMWLTSHRVRWPKLLKLTVVLGPGISDFISPATLYHLSKMVQ